MLVIHWTRHNQTGEILANGIHASTRKRKAIPEAINPKGVYVFPYSRNATLNGNWRRNLKKWDGASGNYNGFVFRLEPEDFPLYAGYWFQIRRVREDNLIKTPAELTRLYGNFFTGQIVDERTETGIPYNWVDFEIIIPHLIKPGRILKVVKDREPRAASRTRRKSSHYQGVD